MTVIRKTKSGKIHLSNVKNKALCSKGNMTMNFTETVSLNDVLQTPKSEFCKTCFADRDPHEFVRELLDTAKAKTEKAKKTVDKDKIGEILKQALEAEEPQPEIEPKTLDEKLAMITTTIDRLTDAKPTYKNAHEKQKANNFIRVLEAVIETFNTNSQTPLDDIVV